MMNFKIVFSVFLLLCCNFLIAQDSVMRESSNRKADKIFFTTNKKWDEMLKSKLLLNKRIVEIICHPKINNTKFDDIVCDSTDNVEITNSEVIICLKNSFSWNVENELPKIPKASVIKTLLKKNEKITEEEREILKYMEFYSQGCENKYVEKYECNQEIEVNRQDNYKIHYELKYDCNDELKIESNNMEKLESN